MIRFAIYFVFCMLSVSTFVNAQDCPAEVCTGEVTPIEICPDFCNLNAPYIISGGSSVYSCSLFFSNSCVVYTPLPGMSLIGGDTVDITACTSDGICQTVEIAITIVEDCEVQNPLQILCVEPDAGNVLVVNWVNDHDCGADFSSYKVYRSDNVDGPFVEVGALTLSTATNFIDTTVPAGSAALYYYVELDCSGSTEVSDVISTLDPHPPTILSVSVEDGDVVITWEAGDFPDSFGTVVYRIISGGPTQIQNISGLSTTQTVDTNANPNDFVESYDLSTVDGCGNIGDFSGLPHSTILLTEQQNPCDGELTFFWSAYQGWDAVLEYRLLKNGLSVGTVNSSSELPLSINYALATNEYTPACFVIEAVNDEGITSLSNEICYNYNFNEDNECFDECLVDPDAFCPAVYDPVCGCDGTTYGNSCEATVSGIISWSAGECNDCPYPILNPDNYTLIENQDSCLYVRNNDNLLQDIGIIFSEVNQPASGTVSYNVMQGCFDYEATPGFTGSAAFQYQVCYLDFPCNGEPNTCATETVVLEIQPDTSNATYNIPFETLQLYPNPVRTTLRFENNDLNLERLEILNLEGKTVLELTSINSGLINIDVAHLANGLYILNAYGNKRRYNGRFEKVD